MSCTANPDVVSYAALSASLAQAGPTSPCSFPSERGHRGPISHRCRHLFFAGELDWARQLSVAQSPSLLTVVYIFPLKGERRRRPICAVNEAHRNRQSHSCRHIGLSLHFQLSFSLGVTLERSPIHIILCYLLFFPFLVLLPLSVRV